MMHKYEYLLHIKMLMLLSCLLLFSTSSLIAQQLKPEKVEVFYDSRAIPELFQQVPVGFTFVFPDGSKTSTEGLLQGRTRWRNVKIYSKQGKINHGKLNFYPKEVWKNNHEVHFKVSYADTTLYCDLGLPYLEKIRFNLFADSIKKEVPYYLNVEGLFSSGKTYPLDTVRLRFSTSVGKLENNVLQISDKDTARYIRVCTVFRWDSTLRSEAIIPVKQYIEKVSLPTKDQLLKQWKRRGRKK